MRCCYKLGFYYISKHRRRELKTKFTAESIWNLQGILKCGRMFSQLFNKYFYSIYFEITCHPWITLSFALNCIFFLASLVEKWFVFWRHVAEPKYSWRLPDVPDIYRGTQIWPSAYDIVPISGQWLNIAEYQDSRHGTASDWLITNLVTVKIQVILLMCFLRS